MGSWSATTYYNVYLDQKIGVSADVIGNLSGFGRLAAGIAALMAPIVIKMLGRKTTIAVGAIGVAGAFVVLSEIQTLAGAGIGYLGVLAMVSIATTSFDVLYQEASHPEWRPVMSGAFILATGASMTLVNIAGGIFIADNRYAALYRLAAVCVIIGTAAFLVYARGRFNTKNKD